MSALTVWSEAAVAVVEPLATIVVNALSVATVQLTSVSAPSPEPGIDRESGVTRVQSRMPSGSGSPEATPCRNAGASAARAGRAAASGAARTAVAAAALTTVRRRGARELRSRAKSDDLCRLVTGDEVTEQYKPRAGEPEKFARSSAFRRSGHTDHTARSRHPPVPAEGPGPSMTAGRTSTAAPVRP
jgi:hypothetical protein